MIFSTVDTNKPGVAPGIVLAFVLALASFWLAKLPGLKVMGALTIALLIGIFWRALAGIKPGFVPGVRTTARSLLRLGIVLMGARLDFRLVAKAGPLVLLLDTAIITLGLLAIPRIAAYFRVPARLGMLLAVGTSICGASAVVAAGPATRAPEEDVTLAVALCGILGTIGVFSYMIAAPFTGLTTLQMAVLSGSTLHEVAQVMATAFSWGTQAGDLGTLVKLTRVVMLAPTLLLLSIVTGGGPRAMKFSWREPPIPWFVIGFLVLGIVSSTGLVTPGVKGGLSDGSVFLMTMAMAAMGLNTPLEIIRVAGLKVIYAGLVGFGLLAATSWTLIRFLGI